MKIPRIVNAVGHIDDHLITAAAESKKKTKYTPWLKWGSIAACFAVLVIAGAAILPSLLGGNVTPGETDARYKEYTCTEESRAIVWRWEHLALNEKYTETELNSIKYSIRSGRAISSKIIGEKIDTCSLVGYDRITGEEHRAEFEAYQIKNVEQDQFIAIDMDGAYFVFQNDEHTPPDTLGELLQEVDLPTVVELNRFSENGGGPDGNHFILNNDDYVWEILSDCVDAPSVSDEQWFVHERDYISFTITAEAIGVYKNAMYVTSDGYLWTNIFSYGYLFDIGEEATKKIMDYSREYSEEAEYEPYEKTVVGKVTEITGNYILIDDSIICNDPADGIIYKISLDDIRISRYVENNVFSVGATVRVVYEDKMDQQNSYTILTASSISKVNLYFADETERDTFDSNSNKTVTVTSSKPSHAPVPE